MSNFNTAINANTTALNSSGSAWEENEKRADSLTAKLSMLKKQFVDLVTGDGGLNTLLKGLIDLGTVILKFLNYTDGLQVGLTAISILLAIKVIPKLILFGSTLATNIGQIALFTAEAGSLSAGLKAVGISASTAQIALGGISAILVAGSIAWGVYSAAEKKAAQARKDTITNSQKEITSLKSAKASLEDENITRDSLNKIVDSNISKYSDEISKIGDLNKARQTSINKINEEIQANAKKITTEGGTDYKNALDKTSEDESGRFYKNVSSKAALTSMTGSSQLSALLSLNKNLDFSSLDKYKESIGQLIEYIQSADGGTEKYSAALKILQSEYSSADSDLTSYNQTIQEYDDALATQGKVYDKTTDSIRGMNQGEYEEYKAKQQSKEATDDVVSSDDDLTDASENVSAEMRAIADAAGITTDQLQDMVDASGMTAEELQAGSDAMGLSIDQYSDFATQLNNLSSDYDTLNEAQEELNETGSLTAETFLKLSNNDLLQYLQNVNGQLTTTTAGLDDEGEAAKITAINQLQNAAAHDIAALAIGDVDSMSQGAQAAVKKVGDNAKTAGSDAATAAPKVASLAVSIQGLIDASKGNLTGGMDLKTFESDSKAITDYYVGLAKEIGDISISGASSASKASKSAGSAAKSTTDTYKEEYEKQKDLLDHKLAMEEISQEDYYKQLYALNEKYFNDTTENHEKYLSDYQKNEETIYKGVKDMLKNMADDYKDQLQDQEDAQLDSIDKQIDAVKKLESQKLDSIDKAIDALKNEKDEALNTIDDEINALKTEQSAVESAWNERIDKYKRANEELDKQNKLLEYQKALAQAQSTQVKVLEEDGTFGYQQDEDAVSEAQSNLDSYQQQLKYEAELQALEDSRDAELAVYDQKIADLEDYRDQVEASYDAQIEAMEAYRDQVQEQYDAQIEAMEEQKELIQEQYDTMIANYEDMESKLFDDQVNAIVTESANWTTRLQNLASFVTDYNAMLSQLGTGGSVSVGYKAAGQEARASGDSSISESGAYVVGEDPHKEIVIGSKLNNGVAMNLSKGSGVVNAKSTNTLAGILNNLSGLSGNGITNGNTNNSQNVTNNFNITANVQDGEGLVDYLQNFSTRMTQKAFA